jgi:hypothetical protein
VNTTEQRLEGPVGNALIQEFAEQEEVEKQQVEAARAKCNVPILGHYNITTFQSVMPT